MFRVIPARAPRKHVRPCGKSGYRGRDGDDDRSCHTHPEWRDAYGSLLRDVAAAVADVPDLDLTVECITHRFTEASKDVLLGWYPRTKLEMDEEARTRKFGKYGAAKYVYPKDTMTELRSWFGSELEETLPMARILYWT